MPAQSLQHMSRVVHANAPTGHWLESQFSCYVSFDAVCHDYRIAMVGFLGLVITEALKGGPLFG